MVSADPTLRALDSLEELYGDIVAVLTPAIPTGYADLTDAAMEDGSNAGTCRIMDAVPVDPEDGTPIPEQYLHRGAAVTFPEENAAGDTRGRDQEGCLQTVVIHGTFRNAPNDQTAATLLFWRWEGQIRGRIYASPVLRRYRPRYVGTRRGISRTGAEWLTFALTLTFYVYRPGATHNG
jgi:hypothetical protein